MLDIFHPAQGAAISGTRASVLGAWRAQRREDGTSVTRRHWQQGERDQAPVYTVEATDWLLPVPGRVPAVGGRDGAMPVVTESRGKLRNCWDDSLRIRRAAWGYLEKVQTYTVGCWPVQKPNRRGLRTRNGLRELGGQEVRRQRARAGASSAREHSSVNLYKHRGSLPVLAEWLPFALVHRNARRNPKT